MTIPLEFSKVAVLKATAPAETLGDRIENSAMVAGFALGLAERKLASNELTEEDGRQLCAIVGQCKAVARLHEELKTAAENTDADKALYRVFSDIAYDQLRAKSAYMLAGDIGKFDAALESVDEKKMAEIDERFAGLGKVDPARMEMLAKAAASMNDDGGNGGDDDDGDGTEDEEDEDEVEDEMGNSIERKKKKKKKFPGQQQGQQHPGQKQPGQQQPFGQQEEEEEEEEEEGQQPQAPGQPGFGQQQGPQEQYAPGQPPNNQAQLAEGAQMGADENIMGSDALADALRQISANTYNPVDDTMGAMGGEENQLAEVLRLLAALQAQHEAPMGGGDPMMGGGGMPGGMGGGGMGGGQGQEGGMAALLAALGGAGRNMG